MEAAHAWVTEKVAEQGKLPAHETPVLTKAGLESRIQTLKLAVLPLHKRPRPIPTLAPVALNATNSSAANATNGTKAGEGAAGKGKEGAEGNGTAVEEEEGGEEEEGEEGAPAAAKGADGEAEPGAQEEDEAPEL